MDNSKSPIARVRVTDRLKSLEDERAMHEQRIVEIDRLLDAVQRILDEVGTARLSSGESSRKVDTPNATTSHIYDKSQWGIRNVRRDTRRGGGDKPTHLEWLAEYAQTHGGFVRLSEAREEFLASGLTSGNPRNVYSNLFGIMKRSSDFEPEGKGLFRWIPYHSSARDVDIDTEEASSESGDFESTKSSAEQTSTQSSGQDIGRTTTY